MNAMPETRPSPHEVVYAHRRTEAIHELIETLPPARGAAFAIRLVPDCSLEETVRSRLRFTNEPLEVRIERNPLLLEPQEQRG